MLNGTYRVPDELTKTMLGEVKNVQTLSGSSQMEDFVSYASKNRLKVRYYIRPTTVLTGKALQYQISGAIKFIRNVK